MTQGCFNKVGHIGISVRDLDASVDYYTSVLGMHLTERFTYPDGGPGHSARESAFLRCATDHHCLSLFVLADDVDAHEPRLGLHHIAFEVQAFEELVALFRRVDEHGSVVEARSGGPGSQPRFYARDPDLNLLEFYWDIDQIGWDGAVRSAPPIEVIDLETFDLAEYAAFKAGQRFAITPGVRS